MSCGLPLASKLENWSGQIEYPHILSPSCTVAYSTLVAAGGPSGGLLRMIVTPERPASPLGIRVFSPSGRLIAKAATQIQLATPSQAAHRHLFTRNLWDRSRKTPMSPEKTPADPASPSQPPVPAFLIPDHRPLAIVFRCQAPHPQNHCAKPPLSRSFSDL